MMQPGLWSLGPLLSVHRMRNCREDRGDNEPPKEMYFLIKIPRDKTSSATEPAPKPFSFVLTAGRHAWPLINASHPCGATSPQLL